MDYDEEIDRLQHELDEARAALWHIMPGTEGHPGQTYRDRCQELGGKLEEARRLVEEVQCAWAYSNDRELCQRIVRLRDLLGERSRSWDQG